jgi:hypothetical protein
MNTYRIPTQPSGYGANPQRYARRRLASIFILSGTVAAAIVASLLESAGLPAGDAVVAGAALFLISVGVATSLEVRDESSKSDEAEDVSQGRSPRGRFRDWTVMAELGHDPEQVIGRHTGARV